MCVITLVIYIIVVIMYSSSSPTFFQDLAKAITKQDQETKRKRKRKRKGKRRKKTFKRNEEEDRIRDRFYSCQLLKEDSEQLLFDSGVQTSRSQLTRDMLAINDEFDCLTKSMNLYSGINSSK